MTVYDNALAENVNGLYKARSSTARAPGGRSSRWSWPLLSGWTGGTRGVCTAALATSHQLNMRPSTIVSTRLQRPRDPSPRVSTGPRATHTKHRLHLWERPRGHRLLSGKVFLSLRHRGSIHGLSLTRHPLNGTKDRRTVSTESVARASYDTADLDAAKENVAVDQRSAPTQGLTAIG